MINVKSKQIEQRILLAAGFLVIIILILDGLEIIFMEGKTILLVTEFTP